MIMKKINGMVITGVVGFIISVSATMFISWECNPAKMTENQRFAIILFGLLSSVWALIIRGMTKKD